MWIADGKRLIALEGRDVKLESRDIVFEGKNLEILRHDSSPRTARLFWVRRAQFFKLLSNV